MEAQGALMLVLSRRLNQTIVIAGHVRVTVLAITPNRVELGVEAPLQIAVDREEIHLRRQNAQPALAAEPESGAECLSPRRQDAKEERGGF
jgi:carbon storage regulator